VPPVEPPQLLGELVLQVQVLQVQVLVVGSVLVQLAQ
jgi:hypothetical protein